MNARSNPTTTGAETARRRTRQPASTDHYLQELEQHLRRLLSRACKQVDLDDIVQTELERVWSQIGDIMSRYPIAAVYASQRCRGRHAVIDYLRKQGAQKGTGALVRFDSNGTARAKGREVVNGHGAFNESGDSGSRHYHGAGHRGATYFDVAALQQADAGADAFDRTVERLSLDAALAQLSLDQRAAVHLVDELGYTVTEAAEIVHVARETACRRRGAAHAAVRRTIER